MLSDVLEKRIANSMVNKTPEEIDLYDASRSKEIASGGIELINNIDRKLPLAVILKKFRKTRKHHNK